MQKPVCKYCGCLNMKYSWQIFKNNTKHIRADCSGCGKYVQYAKQNSENLAAAGPEPKSEVRVAACISCGNNNFLVNGTELCGPCCHGEAETVIGNF